MKQSVWVGIVGVGLLGMVACSGSSTSTSTSGSGGTSSSSCTLTDNTTATDVVNQYGCAVLTRDTSSCEAARTAQGLTGYWLKFSCRVSLTVSGNNVIVAIDSQPDYKNYYFETTDPCYASATLSGRSPNPNITSAQSITATIPKTGTKTGSPTAASGGTIGVALNGVSIFDNAAAPGDSIYQEVQTFDLCNGHPQNSGNYHYHIEPNAITNADDQFLGVMRDGFPIYGRYGDGTSTDVTGLDSAGGHTSTTVDSPTTPVYHYHLNLQTNGTESEYFISTGYLSGTVGSCSGCN